MRSEPTTGSKPEKSALWIVRVESTVGVCVHLSVCVCRVVFLSLYIHIHTYIHCIYTQYIYVTKYQLHSWIGPSLPNYMCESALSIYFSSELEDSRGIPVSILFIHAERSARKSSVDLRHFRQGSIDWPIVSVRERKQGFHNIFQPRHTSWWLTWIGLLLLFETILWPACVFNFYEGCHDPYGWKLSSGIINKQMNKGFS